MVEPMNITKESSAYLEKIRSADGGNFGLRNFTQEIEHLIGCAFREGYMQGYYDLAREARAIASIAKEREVL